MPEATQLDGKLLLSAEQAAVSEGRK